MSNRYKEVGLYPHNEPIYDKVKYTYLNGEDIVGVIQATGTGKTYIALQLSYDNKGKKILYVTPSNGIIEHVKEVIENNPNLDLQRDFSGLSFRTYQSFINMSKEELAALDVDILIVDELHHLGAPVWGERIKTIIETHPNIKVFGMTAYTVRDRGTSYERDMANPDTNELFSNKIVSRYDLVDALIDGVLPKPIYKSACINLMGLEAELEQRVKRLNASSKEYQEYMAILNDCKKRIQEAPGIADVVKRSIKRDGKYIYFCPPGSEEGVNDIETIMAEAKQWFIEMGLREEDIVFYQTTSEMGIDGKLNREAFYNDITLDGASADGKLRVMFAINQYNEGVHAPNVDGAILGRGTSSDIVYFEQIGRALSVRTNTRELYKKYEGYTKDELLEICREKDILVSEESTKEEIIEKLISPLIIDLAGNFYFIRELENNLKDRIKQIQESGLGEKREIKIRDASFDIEIENLDLFEMLRYLSDRLTISWEEMYEYARVYYEYHGNLEVPSRFKTSNGYEYDEEGTINLGIWIYTQRRRQDNLLPERRELLSKIGMRFGIKKLSWEEMYEYARVYYEYHGDLEVPKKFKTSNGYEYDEEGTINLGIWIANQRSNQDNLTPERYKLLTKIGIRFENKVNRLTWEEMYEYARVYYEYHGNLEVPFRFKTSNGYEYDEEGTINLGIWIANQRSNQDNLTPERYKLLTKIGIRFENKVNRLPWEEMYEYARVYYEHHGDLEVPYAFKTNNGYEYDEEGTINLGVWIRNQRSNQDNLTPGRYKLLTKIGIRFENKVNRLPWEEMYEYARVYYEYHGNLQVPVKFKTNNGYEYDEEGTINLGVWIRNQRSNQDNLTPERYKLLTKIGIKFEKKVNRLTWEEMYEYAKIYYEHHGNLEVPYLFKTSNGYEYDEEGKINLGIWIATQRSNQDNLTPERRNLLTKIGMRFENKVNRLPWEEMYEYARVYYEHHGNLEVPAKFKTSNGYEYDPNGTINLGVWISNQRRNQDNLTPERRNLLIKIGMIWDVKKNKDEIKGLCLQYNIDVNLNKIVLEHISYQELYSKIKYLESINIDITSNGILHEIFSMSSLNMRAKYGIFLEEVIEAFYISRKK